MSVTFLTVRQDFLGKQTHEIQDIIRDFGSEERILLQKILEGKVPIPSKLEQPLLEAMHQKIITHIDEPIGCGCRFFAWIVNLFKGPWFKGIRTWQGEFKTSAELTSMTEANLAKTLLSSVKARLRTLFRKQGDLADTQLQLAMRLNAPQLQDKARLLTQNYRLIENLASRQRQPDELEKLIQKQVQLSSELGQLLEEQERSELHTNAELLSLVSKEINALLPIKFELYPLERDQAAYDGFIRTPKDRKKCDLEKTLASFQKNQALVVRLQGRIQQVPASI